MFIAASISFFTNQQAMAAGSKKVNVNTYQTDGNFNKLKVAELKSDTITILISGIVKEQGTGLPLLGVPVKIKGSNTVVTTDVNGKFHFPYHTINANELILQASFIGYLTAEQRFIPNKSQEITLELAESFMGEVVVVRKPENFYLQLFQKLRRWLR